MVAIDEYENCGENIWFRILFNYYNLTFLFYGSFFPIFNFVYQLIDDEESIGYVTESVIRDFKKDGVHYLELRTTPRSDKNGITKI